MIAFAGKRNKQINLFVNKLIEVKKAKIIVKNYQKKDK